MDNGDVSFVSNIRSAIVIRFYSQIWGNLGVTKIPATFFFYDFLFLNSVH